MEFSRRNFIKASGGVVALGVVGVTPFTDWIRPASAEGEKQEKIAYTFHPPNCGGRCSYKCTVRDGKLVKLEPNEWPDPNQNKCCLRGLSEIERNYSPDRLKTPLKRVGERGEGKFVAISWDEALKTVADKFTEMIEKYGGKSVLYGYSSNICYPFNSLAAMLGFQNPSQAFYGIDLGQASGMTAVMGINDTGTNEITDWVNSKMIILVGNNLLEPSLTDSAFFFEAKEKGVKMVCIDPSYSTTASKCNQWISIRPGTDSALYLGMINLILNNKWYDADYISKYTSAPFLIRQDNKAIMREGDKYLVWDKNSNSAKPSDTPGITPALEGEYTVNGVTVKTVLTGFIEHVKDYTPAWASKVTEIPEQVITDLTKEYALGGPAAIQWGVGGPDKWYNSDTTGRLGTMVAGLTGNIGRVGGGTGRATNHMTNFAHFAAFSMPPWPLPPQFKNAPAEVTSHPDYLTKPNSIKGYFFQGNTLKQYLTNMNQTIKWVKSLEFIVGVDNQHCDSINYADIVLPACSFLESEYDIAYLTADRNHVLMQQKVLEPLFESKSDFQIEKEIAKRMGLDQYLPKTPEDYNRNSINSPDPMFKGITIEGLKANKCILRLNVPNTPFVGYLDHKFGTPSGKIELYNEVFIEDNCAFPIWQEPNEAYPSNPLAKKYPLTLGTPHSRFRAHSTFSNSRWINQVLTEPIIRINPKDAQARGLKNNDYIEVFNDRGSFQCKCNIVNDIRPGMIQMPEGWWSRYFKKGDMQMVTNSNMNPRGEKLFFNKIIPYLDCLVEVKRVEG